LTDENADPNKQGADDGSKEALKASRFLLLRNVVLVGMLHQPMQALQSPPSVLGGIKRLSQSMGRPDDIYHHERSQIYTGRQA
jgi:hypothetical protein